MSDRSYTGYPLSALRAIAHSLFELPEGTRRWPPRGWTYHGLAHHRAQHAKACALLIAYADPTACELAAQRAREQERRHLAAHLPGALEAVLEAIGEDDTASLDMRQKRNRRDRPEAS